MRTLTTACITYNSTYGLFPGALASLASPGSGNPSSNSADLVDSVLANAGSAPGKSGYTFTYGSAAGTYSIKAAPLTLNQTGLREFYTDPSGVIRFNVGAVADQSSTPLQ
jgi:hypothetical protein